MKYTEFKSGLEGGESFPVYLFEGEDAFFRERGLALLKSKFISNPEIDCSVMDGDFSANDLVGNLSGYPFLSKKRMVVLREFYPKQELFKNGLREYLENPSPLSILVVLNEKPCEPLKKYPSVLTVDCAKQDALLVARFVKSECAREGVEIDLECARLIGEYCLFDMTRVDVETQKVIAYAKQDGIVTKPIIEMLVSKDNQFKIYELTNFIGKKDFKNAMAVIKELMAKGESEQGILNYVYTYFRRLLHVAISNMDKKEMANVFKVKEYALTKMQEQSAMFSKRNLKKAVDMLTDIDYKVKSGRADVNEKMWLVIFKIITE